MEDIAPRLLEKIQNQFNHDIAKSSIIKNFKAKVQKGKVTYNQANEATQEIGRILAKAYADNLSSNVLPNGRMYYNIASRILNPTLIEAYSMAADNAEIVQRIMNEAAGIGIKAMRAQIQQGSIDGIVNRISGEEYFDDVNWILDAPVRNLVQKAMDDTVKKNADFHAQAGLKPRIIRRSSGHCCEWCNQVAGTYIYPDVPKDVFRRHDNCDCVLEYYPGDGKKQNVWTKEWRYEKEFDKIEERKNLSSNIHYKLANMPKDEYARAKKLWQKNIELSLPGREKEHIYEELDNNLTTEERESCIVRRAIGEYYYTAINMGHNQYKIINKEPIEDIDAILDEVLDFNWRGYDGK